MGDGRNEAAWVEAAWGALRGAGVRQVAYVPDAGLVGLIDRARAAADVTAVSLSTEEEGIAVLAGAWLGGQRGALLMQSSGVGNCMNMFSLARVCRFPCLVIVTMRGQFGESNPWQVPMGQASATLLRECGVVVYEVDDAADMAGTVEAAATMAFSGSAAVAVLVGQRVIGAKAFQPESSVESSVGSSGEAVTAGAAQ